MDSDYQKKIKDLIMQFQSNDTSYKELIDSEFIDSTTNNTKVYTQDDQEKRLKESNIVK